MFSLPLTSAENLAECRETKSFSSWSKLQSIRFVSHERIPASQRRKGENMKCVVLLISHEENNSLCIWQYRLPLATKTTSFQMFIYWVWSMLRYVRERSETQLGKITLTLDQSKEGSNQIIRLCFRSFQHIELKPNIS